MKSKAYYDSLTKTNSCFQKFYSMWVLNREYFALCTPILDLQFSGQHIYPPPPPPLACILLGWRLQIVQFFFEVQMRGEKGLNCRKKFETKHRHKVLDYWPSPSSPSYYIENQCVYDQVCFVRVQLSWLGVFARI